MKKKQTNRIRSMMSSETWKPDLLIKTGVTLEGLCCARLLAPVVSVKSSKGSPRQELSLLYRQENWDEGKFPISGEKRQDTEPGKEVPGPVSLAAMLCLLPLHQYSLCSQLHCSTTTRSQSRVRSCERNQTPAWKDSCLQNNGYFRHLAPCTLPPSTYIARKPTRRTRWWVELCKPVWLHS